MTLLCAFCMNLPGRSQGDEAMAWTVINGHAVCRRHHEFAQLEGTWLDALAEARDWESFMAGGKS
jgi:hypothetical protein